MKAPFSASVAGAVRRTGGRETLRFLPLDHEPGLIGFVEKHFLGQLLGVSRPRLVVEDGTFHGLTTIFMAEFLRLNGVEGAKVVSFDLEPIHAQLKTDGPNIAEHPLIKLVSGWLPSTLERFLGSKPDPIGFALIDAMHDYRSVKRELELIYPRLSDGAYVFRHDYRKADSDFHEVVVTIDRFAQRMGCDLLPLNPSEHDGKEIVWGAAVLRKPPRYRSHRRNACIARGATINAITERLKRVLRKSSSCGS